MSSLAAGSAAAAVTWSVEKALPAQAQGGTGAASGPPKYTVYLPAVSRGTDRAAIWVQPPPGRPADVARLRQLQPPLGVENADQESLLPADEDMPVVEEQTVGPDGAPVRVSTITLPRNLLKNAGALLEDFENAAAWAVIGGTVAANTAQKLTGSRSLKITPDVSDVPYASAIVEKVRTLNLGANDMLQWSYYHHGSGPADLDGLMAWLSGDAQWSKWFEVNLPNNNNWYYDRPGAWNTVRVLRSDWSNPTGDTWTAPRYSVNFGVDPASGVQAVTSLDNLRGGVQPVPAVMLSLDDNAASVYTEAFAYARQHGVRATAYVTTDWVGQPGYTTVAQLQEMAANGWAIANHTSDHTRLAVVSQAMAQTTLRGARVALEGWGLGAAARHVAYPNNSYNATTVLAAMAAEGMLTGRTTDGAPYFMPDDPLRIPCRSFDSYTSLDEAKMWVDRAIARNELLVAYCHAIETTPTQWWNWTIEGWRGLIDYIVAKKLPTINVADFYKLTGGSVKVPLPY